MSIPEVRSSFLESESLLFFSMEFCIFCKLNIFAFWTVAQTRQDKSFTLDDWKLWWAFLCSLRMWIQFTAVYSSSQPIKSNRAWLDWPCFKVISWPGGTSGIALLCYYLPSVYPSTPKHTHTHARACARSTPIPPVSPSLFTQVPACSVRWWTPVQTLTLRCLSGKCQNKSCHN